MINSAVLRTHHRDAGRNQSPRLVRLLRRVLEAERPHDMVEIVGRLHANIQSLVFGVIVMKGRRTLNREFLLRGSWSDAVTTFGAHALLLRIRKVLLLDKQCYQVLELGDGYGRHVKKVGVTVAFENDQILRGKFELYVALLGSGS